MVSLERLLPRDRTLMWPLQWHLKDSWSPVMDDPATPIPLSQTCVETVRWWLQEVRFRPCPCRCIQTRLWLIYSVWWPRVWSEKASQEHITVLYGGETRSSSFPASVSWPVRRPDERQCIRCRLSPTSRWHCVLEIMPYGVHHHSVDQAAFSSVGGSVCFRKAECFGRSAKLTR